MGQSSDLAAVMLPANELGLSTLEELIGWTETYFHFKYALEVVGLSSELATQYIAAFDQFAERLSQDIGKQDQLESRLPIEMRQAIAGKKPHLDVIRVVLAARVQPTD